MDFTLNSKDYMDYIAAVNQELNEQEEYITNLDLATGDGDHWANLHMGFTKLTEEKSRLEALDISSELKEIGKIMMAVIGGSSGVLYGSAYLKAAVVMKGKDVIHKEELFEILNAMLNAIMDRGQAKPGYKTMIDSLFPAVMEYKAALEEKLDVESLCKRVAEAAERGAEDTKNMESIKGRATYQSNKGVGHLDPGAVTMALQIKTLMNKALEKRGA
jgi:dihydroxyacetone kinase, L subunit